MLRHRLAGAINQPPGPFTVTRANLGFQLAIISPPVLVHPVHVILGPQAVCSIISIQLSSGSQMQPMTI